MSCIFMCVFYCIQYNIKYAYLHVLKHTQLMINVINRLVLECY